MSSPDNCPTCDKRITDFDELGCEAPDGQRWCIEHALNELSRLCKLKRGPLADAPSAGPIVQEYGHMTMTASEIMTELSKWPADRPVIVRTPNGEWWLNIVNLSECSPEDQALEFDTEDNYDPRQW